MSIHLRDPQSIIRQYGGTTSPIVDRIKEEIQFEEDHILYPSDITYLLYAYVLVRINRPGPWRIMRYIDTIIVTDGAMVIAPTYTLTHARQIMGLAYNVCRPTEIIPLLYQSFIETAMGANINPDHILLYDTAISFVDMVFREYPPYGCHRSIPPSRSEREYSLSDISFRHS